MISGNCILPNERLTDKYEIDVGVFRIDVIYNLHISITIFSNRYDSGNHLFFSDLGIVLF